MRKILYPFFILSIIAGIYYFLGENFSPFVQKILLILGITFAFFIFREIFFFLFGWIIKSFSKVIKSVIAGILFLLLLFGIWKILPSDITHQIKNIFSNNYKILKKKTEEKSIDKNNEKSKDKQGETQYKIVSSNKTYPNNNDIDEKLTISPSEISISSNRTPRHLLKKIENENEKNKNKDNKTTESNNKPHYTWKKPVVKYIIEDKKISNNSEPQNNDNNPEKNNAKKLLVTQNIPSEKTKKKIKLSGGELIKSGPSKDMYSIVFREINAQIIFPVEYVISNVIWTDREKTIDEVDFTVLTPKETKAKISVVLLDSGKDYEKYFPLFTTTKENENTFYVSNKSKNNITYITFFDGILWKITIELENKEDKTIPEEDFYKILLPISFEKIK